MSVLPVLKDSKQNSSKLSSSAFVLRWHMRHKIHNQMPNVRSNLSISLVTYFTNRTISKKVSVLPVLKDSKQNSTKLSSSAFVLRWHMRHKIHNQMQKVRSNLVNSLVTYFTYRTISKKILSYLSWRTPSKTLRNSALVPSYWGGIWGIRSITKRQMM